MPLMCKPALTDSEDDSTFVNCRSNSGNCLPLALILKGHGSSVRLLQVCKVQMEELSAMKTDVKVEG